MASSRSFRCHRRSAIVRLLRPGSLICRLLRRQLLPFLRFLHKLVEIACGLLGLQPLDDGAVLIIPLVGKPPGYLCRDLARVLQNVAVVERKEGVELARPLAHGHQVVSRGLIFGVVEIHGDDTVQLGDFRLQEVVLRYRDIGLANPALGGVFPGG